jgi:ureidoacrylate peracid hydrolase
MEPEKTALVLIEYQNDFTSEGGTLHQAVKPVMESTNMLANTVETVAKARELGERICDTATDASGLARPAEPHGVPPAK